MVESTGTRAPSPEDPGAPAARPPRRPLLFAALGVVLAAALAAVLLTQTGRGTGSGGVVISGQGAARLDGITAPTANLLSLSVLPGSGRAAPDFQLTDQGGRPFSLSQFRGRSVVLSFNDDQCTDVCTLLAEDVVRADQDLGPRGRARVVFVSVNVNPFHPQVSAVRSWTDANGLGRISNWVFGTASPAALQAVWKAYGVYVGTDAATRTVTHSTLVEYIDPAGRIRATGDFGQNAVDVDPYSHGLAQAAVDLLPASQRTPVAGPQAPSNRGPGAGIGQTAPGFSLPVLAAGPAGSLDLQSLRGRPVVLNFWASTCVDCRAELAAFAQVAAADPKIAFVGVDVADPSRSGAVSLARAAGVRYPVVSDRGGTVAAAYQVSGLPTTVYLDPAGSVMVVHPGAMTAEQLRYTLAQFFPGSTPAGS
ncbi:MAG TPA: redoxin domain-containing protein [Acidimicrobiales bacterium]|nr:redoxin domain-containing protein [Acidimicrobiales bacterium]